VVGSVGQHEKNSFKGFLLIIATVVFRFEIEESFNEKVGGLENRAE
jgi:hypothetical protein